MKKYLTTGMLFFTGGFLYVVLELIWRQSSHWTMFMAGGSCFTLVDWCNRKLRKATPFWVRCSIGAAIITGVEFVTGCVVNLWAHWNVWDYSQYKLQFMGQVCFLYTVFWFFLTMPIIWLSKALRDRFDRFQDRFGGGFLLARFRKRVG